MVYLRFNEVYLLKCSLFNIWY